MKKSATLTAPPEMTVAEAARQMARRKTGAVMVIDNGRLVGIFTERDAVFRVIARGLDVEAARLADVMTLSPATIAPDRPFGVALAIMHKNGFRHLPVVDADGRPLGIVSARHALDPELEDFVAESRRRARFEQQG
jgi:CBS domain-containing protein